MELHIRHETLYRYEEPVKRSVQNLRLTPRREPCQRALTWQIVAPGRQSAQIDAHGNVVHMLTVDEPHREIRIVVAGVVETDDAELLMLPDEGRLSPLAYLAETPLTRADDVLRQFSLEHLTAHTVTGMLDLATAVSTAVKYKKGATEVTETAVQALMRGEGVCQDHAHVFIACCRAANIPARYVSGYFYPGPTERIASHAWVDVWLGRERGWTSVDVTHGKLTGGPHCRLAVGRDYLDACPVRGVRRGGGDETLHVDVSVAASEQQQQQQ
jgi:transglutaminase-like putative cysteine protease